MTRLMPNAVSEMASATSAASTHHQFRWASVRSDFSRMCSFVMMIAARPAAAITATAIRRHRFAVPPLLILNCWSSRRKEPFWAVRGRWCGLVRLRYRGGGWAAVTQGNPAHDPGLLPRAPFGQHRTEVVGRRSARRRGRADPGGHRGRDALAELGAGRRGQRVVPAQVLAGG